MTGTLFGEPPPPRRRRLPRTRDSELRPRPVRLPDHELRSERDLVNALAGVYHLDDIADAAEQAGLADLNGGRGRRKRGDFVSRHRVRSALADRNRRGDARPLGDAYWLIDGPAARPAYAVFVFCGELSGISLAVGQAADMARRLGDEDEPAAMVFTDPPWQRGIGAGRDGHPDFDWWRRSREMVIGGYQDVPPERDYLQWSAEWIGPAAAILRPGGYLAVVTDPEHAAAVQIAAGQAGLTFVNSLAVPKVTGVAPTSRRFATSHLRITVMSHGTPAVFNPIPEMGVDQRGRPAPRDVWTPVQPYQAHGRLRYPNQLPPSLADQVIRTLTNGGDLVADFFAGAGTVPRTCWLRGRRCFASDSNPEAVRFTMAAMNDIAGPLAGPALFSHRTEAW